MNDAIIVIASSPRSKLFGPSGIILGRDLVHPKGKQACFEVFDVSIASRSSFYRHDLPVDPMRAVGRNVIDLLLQTPRWFSHRCHLGTNDSRILIPEVALCLTHCLLGPESHLSPEIA